VGGNNAGTKWLVAACHPSGPVASAFSCRLLLLAVLRFTSWLGEYRPLTAGLRRQLWWRAVVSRGVYRRF